MTTTESPNRYLQGNFRPVDDEITRDRPRGGGRPSPRRSTAATCAPGRTRSACRTRPTYHWFIGDGMVHGVDLRGGGAELVPQPVGPLARGRRRAGRGGGPRPGRGRRLRRIGQHQRRRPRRVDLRHQRAVPALRAHRRARHRRARRLRRHRCRRVHRPPQVRPGHRRDARDRLLWARAATSCTTSSTRRRLVRSEAIDVGGPVMVHDLALTERHVVVFDLPSCSTSSGDGRRRASPTVGRRLPCPRRRLPRDGGDADVRWFDIDPATCSTR